MTSTDVNDNEDNKIKKEKPSSPKPIEGLVLDHNSHSNVGANTTVDASTSWNNKTAETKPSLSLLSTEKIRGRQESCGWTCTDHLNKSNIDNDIQRYQQSIDESTPSPTTTTSSQLPNSNNTALSSNSHTTKLKREMTYLSKDLNSDRTNTSGKPPYSYATLIRYAIENSPNQKLTLSQIYDWVIEHYPYYATAGPGWKNSIRHNLSLNKCFVRTPRPVTEPGKGSYWKVDNYVKESEAALKSTRLVSSSSISSMRHDNTRRRSSTTSSSSSIHRASNRLRDIDLSSFNRSNSSPYRHPPPPPAEIYNNHTTPWSHTNVMMGRYPSTASLSSFSPTSSSCYYSPGGIIQSANTVIYTSSSNISNHAMSVSPTTLYNPATTQSSPNAVTTPLSTTIDMSTESPSSNDYYQQRTNISQPLIQESYSPQQQQQRQQYPLYHSYPHPSYYHPHVYRANGESNTHSGQTVNSTTTATLNNHSRNITNSSYNHSHYSSASTATTNLDYANGILPTPSATISGYSTQPQSYSNNGNSVEANNSHLQPKQQQHQQYYHSFQYHYYRQHLPHSAPRSDHDNVRTSNLVSSNSSFESKVLASYRGFQKQLHYYRLSTNSNRGGDKNDSNGDNIMPNRVSAMHMPCRDSRNNVSSPVHAFIGTPPLQHSQQPDNADAASVTIKIENEQNESTDDAPALSTVSVKKEVATSPNHTIDQHKSSNVGLRRNPVRSRSAMVLDNKDDNCDEDYSENEDEDSDFEEEIDDDNSGTYHLNKKKDEQHLRTSRSRSRRTINATTPLTPYPTASRNQLVLERNSTRHRKRDSNLLSRSSSTIKSRTKAALRLEDKEDEAS